MDRIIFLDVDGVLKPFDDNGDDHGVWPEEEFDFNARCVKNLNDILRFFGDITLVISSDWRFLPTEWHMTGDRRLHRGFEIEEFLDSHVKDAAKIMILDDMPFGEFNNAMTRGCIRPPQFIQTNHRTGLSDKDVKTAINALDEGATTITKKELEWATNSM